MAMLDLRPFGLQRDVELQGTVAESWTEGKRLVFLFGENHMDREMIGRNLLSACTLGQSWGFGWGARVSKEPTDGTRRSRWGQDWIKEKSKRLFEEHRDDCGVISHLRQQPSWYGDFRFGKTLKLLRQSLEVRCVEDLDLREQMKPIADRYALWELGAGRHPSPEHRNLSSFRLGFSPK